MARVVRFLKVCFFVGGSAALVSLFTSTDIDFSVKTIKDLAKGRSTSDLKQDPHFSLPDDKRLGEFREVQKQVVKSEQTRAEKSIVRYKDVDYVLIDRKYYPYNPKNIYVINGVTTFFKPGGYDQLREARATARIERLKKTHKTSHRALLEKADSLLKNPLKGYSRKGISEMQNTIDEIKKSASARNRALEAIASE